MKKQFSPRHSYGRSSVNAFTLGFGGVVLLALIFIFLRIFFPAASVAIATPLWQAGSSFNSGIGNFFSGFGNSTKLAQENAAFVSEVADAPERE